MLLNRLRVHNRLQHVLSLFPCPISTLALAELCGSELVFARSNVLKHLNRMEREGEVRKTKVDSVIGTGQFQAWIGSRWFREPGFDMSKGVYVMPNESLRRTLPERRRCLTQKVTIITSEGKRQTVHYSFGLYEDGSPGELFIDVAKAGAALRQWAGESAMMLSIALQHGTPLLTILSLYVGTSANPSGQVEGHDRIRYCTSIMDLIARDMAVTFLQREDLADIAAWSIVPVPISDKAQLPPPVEGQTCVCHQHKQLQRDNLT